MKRIVRLAVLVPLALLSGCLSSAQEYVNENQQGFYTVKGEIKEIEGLTATKWEDLSDGFVLIVDHPGCDVTLQQGETKRSRFDLRPGDRIVHGMEHDFLLSALAPNQKTDQPERTPPEKAPPAEDDSSGAGEKPPGEEPSEQE